MGIVLRINWLWHSDSQEPSGQRSKLWLQATAIEKFDVLHLGMTKNNILRFETFQMGCIGFSIVFIQQISVYPIYLESRKFHTIAISVIIIYTLRSN